MNKLFDIDNILFNQENKDYILQILSGLNNFAIITLTDREGNFIYANENFCQISGYNQNELIGKNHRIVNSNYHSKEFFTHLWNTILEGKIWRGEIRNISKFDEYFWVDSTIIPIKDSQNEIIEFLALRFDITSKKETDGLYKELINTSPEGFWLSDFNGKLLEVNEAYILMSGYSRSELLKMSIKDLEAIESESDIIAHIAKVKERGYDRFETQHRKKDGTILDIEISVSIFPMRHGILTIFVRDITENKKIINLLNQEKIRAEKLSESKSRFLSTMSHEIRSPLNGINGMVRLLLENTDDPSTKNDLTRILKTSEGLNGLINEILDYSRIEAGKIFIENSEFNIHEIIDPMLVIFDITAKQKSVDLICEIDSNIPKILIGDHFRIRQILTNIVGNAIKFTDKGYVKIKVLHIGIINNRAKIKFIIEDTGIGIDPSVLKNLTIPFVQADNSISRKFGGSGLGLFISKNLLQLMDSNLDFTSEQGKGSIFSFTLNLLAPSKSISKIEVTTSKIQSLKQIFEHKIAHLKNKKILIVEDDCVNQTVIAGYLRIASIKYVIANNGEDCLNILLSNEHEFDGILMDIHMPILNGLEASLKIRKLKIDIPIIALTAGVTEDEIKKCLEYGMNDILMKPIDPAILANMLTKYIAL